MRRIYRQIPLLFLAGLVLTAGCASTKARKAADSPADPQAQITQLQSELAAKDQQIQELQYQLQSSQTAIQTPSNFSSAGTGKSSYIRVSGVSVEDVQRALAQAGFDPGPVDGRMGRKTKSAIKDFQRRNHLTVDGIVGERTWSYLKS